MHIFISGNLSKNVELGFLNSWLTYVSLGTRKLTKVLRTYVASAEKPGINEQLYKAIKALEYIFKFIVRSRVLFNQ